MYHYSNYTTPVQSNLNQPLIIPLPSCTNQWVTLHHMHILRNQLDLSAWSMVILDQSEAMHKY